MVFFFLPKININNPHYCSLLFCKVKTPTIFSTVMTMGLKEQQLEVKQLYIIALLPINQLTSVPPA